jgi:thiol-disulfide isomerase/thioredoxin
MRNRRYLGILILLFILFAFMQTISAQQNAPQGLTDFWTLDINGNEITQTIFSPYKLTMVNIWATFCPPCLQEMPDLAELQKEYKDKGVNIIGIVTDVYHSNQQIFNRNLTTANLIIEKTGANYLHLLPSEDLVNAKLKNVQAVPETFFVDSKGNFVGQSYVGARSKSAWETVIESTLGKL